MNEHHHDAAAFDAYAVDFDETVGSSVIVQGLRQRIYQIIRDRVPAGHRILDINCGTGTDCLALSAMGYRTQGVDLSPAMIERARAKVPAGSQVRFDVVPFDRLSELTGDAFDLVLSNNSGLNCTSDLRGVLRDIHGRLRAGGLCIAVLMPPFSLWELFAGLVRLKPRYAFRRGKRGIANIGGRMIDVWYYGEHDVRREAAGLFVVDSVTGLNIISPSPNSLGFVQRHEVSAAVLAVIDRRISGIPIIRQWGDQILFVMRKVSL